MHSRYNVNISLEKVKEYPSDDGSPIFFLFSPNFQLKKFTNFSINYGYNLWYQIIATCEGKKEKGKKRAI